jgi:hypothetical protein
MSVVAPMTTEMRGGECEVPFPKPLWLKEKCVVNVLGIAGVDNAKIIPRIGPFPGTNMDQISEVMAKMLGMKKAPLKPALRRTATANACCDRRASRLCRQTHEVLYASWFF